MSFREGRELSVKYREMVAIGVLCFRGQHDGVVAHMRRAIEHGATKRALVEAIQSAAVPRSRGRAAGHMASRELW